MKQLPLLKFHQVYSSSCNNRPNYVWVIELESRGVLYELIEQCSISSTGWTGWGYLVSETELEGAAACLLFEHSEDAVMAKLVYGEQLYAN